MDFSSIFIQYLLEVGSMAVVERRARIFRTKGECDMKSWIGLVAIVSTSIVVVVLSYAGATSFGASSYSVGNMASWIQAIGTIAAIIGAIFISRLQSAEENSRLRNERLIENQSLYETIKALAD
jgi:protein-S-isoprenylcysteine O-methyltransferase Ste14